MNIKNNTEESKFEYSDNGETAYIKYGIYKKKNLAIMHTTVPESMKGKGVGSALAEYAFNYARENNKLLLVYCSFVSGYIKRHPELRALLNPEFHPSSTLKQKR